MGEHLSKEVIDYLKPKPGRFQEIYLPSRGKFYNGEDGPTNGILHIKAMTGEEEQILADLNLIRNGQNVNMIFENCLKERYLPQNLLSADRTYMLIYLRSMSYTPEYEIEVTCPDTGQKISHKINLSADLKVNYCPNDFNASNLLGILPVSNFKFKYRFPTGKDEVIIQAYKKKFNEDNIVDETIIIKLALLLEDIEGLTDKNELIILIKKLPIKDVSYLRNLTNNIPFGIDPKIIIFSPYSNNEFEIYLPFETGFFLPSPDSEKGMEAYTEYYKNLMEEQLFFLNHFQVDREAFLKYPILERKYLINRFIEIKEKEHQEIEKAKKSR